jgi:hypothetical protein
MLLACEIIVSTSSLAIWSASYGLAAMHKLHLNCIAFRLRCPAASSHSAFLAQLQRMPILINSKDFGLLWSLFVCCLSDRHAHNLKMTPVHDDHQAAVPACKMFRSW